MRAATVRTSVEFPARAETLLRTFQRRRNIAGMSVIARDGDGRSYRYLNGYASLTHGARVCEKTRFHIGSVSKHMVACLVLALRDRGMLSLADPIGARLPGLPQDWRAVPVYCLLTHTSGLPECYARLPGWGKSHARDALMPIFEDMAADYPAGSAWTYSNTNYILLGWLIEALTGRTLRDVMENEVYARAGLPDACHDSTRFVVQGRAEPYVHVHDAFMHADRMHDSISDLGGFGGLMSARDVEAWRDALARPPLSAVDGQCYEPATLSNGVQVPYGHGWFAGVTSARRIYWHGGAPPGFRAVWVRIPDLGASVFICVNTKASSHAVLDLAVNVLESLSPGSTYHSKTPEPLEAGERLDFIRAFAASPETLDESAMTTEMALTWKYGSLAFPGGAMAVDAVALCEEHSFGPGTLARYRLSVQGEAMFITIGWNADGKVFWIGE